MTLHPRFTLVAIALTVALAACSKDDAGADAAAGGTATATAPAGSGQADADLADITKYELTMDKVDRYLAAQRNIARKVAAMPEAEKAAIKAKQEAEDSIAEERGEATDDGSLEGMARKIESIGPMNEAVREAGLSPREYATLTIAMMQAGMAMSVLKMRPKDNQDSLAREMKVNPANIAFMRENEAEITRKSAEVAAEVKALEQQSGGGESE